MAITVEELQVLISAETAGLKRELERFKKQMSGVSQEVKKSTDSINKSFQTIKRTLVGLGLGMMFRNAVRDAMQFEASMQQINRLMGNSAAEFRRWADEQAAAFGMARSEAIQYGAIFANLISGFSSGTAETMERTRELLRVSSIISSATGRTMEDTMNRIRSGLLGSTEAIEDLGININVSLLESTQAFRDFAGDRSWQQLDFNTQQTIRYFAILEQAAAKYGLELEQNTTSRQAAFTAELKNAQLALGQAFLPIYNTVLPALTSMARALAETMQYIAAFSQALFGTSQQQQIKATEAQAGAITDVGDAYEEAGKKAKGSVAGFDEVNQLMERQETGGGAGVGVGVTAGETQGLISESTSGIDEMASKAAEAANKVREAFTTMREKIVENKDLIIAALAGLSSGFATYLVATKWPSIIGGITTAFAGLRTAIMTTWAAITGPIGLVVAAVAAVTAAFVYFYRTNETFRGVVDGILQKIGEVAEWLWTNILVPLGNYLAQGFRLAWEGITKVAEWLWKNVLIPFGDFLKQFYDEVIKPLAILLADVLAVAFKTVSEIAKSFWQNVLVPLGKAISESFRPAVEALSAVFAFLWEQVLKPFGSFLGETFKSVWESLIEVIEFLWHNVLKPVAEYIGNAFLNTFETVFETIGTLIENAKNAFIGLMNFITGVFTGDWEKAWNGVKDIFKAVFDSLYDIVRAPLNLIIGAINQVIDGLNSIKIDIPSWVPGYGGRSFGINIPKIKEIPALARGGIVDSPTLAMIGEAGKEAVVPLENTAFVDKLASALGAAVMNAMSMSLQMNTTAQGNTEIVLKMDTREVARAIAPALNQEQQRQGTRVIIQPT